MIDPMTPKILTSNGKEVLLDECDYAEVSKYKWNGSNNARRRSVYAFRNVVLNGKHTTQAMHIFLLNPPKGLEVDHINGNGLDNRRSNLRLCTHAENGRNQAVQPRTKSSKFKGVVFRKRDRVWIAQIVANGKRHHLGTFNSEEIAAGAYDNSARKLHGKFACLNFPMEAK